MKENLLKLYLTFIFLALVLAIIYAITYIVPVVPIKDYNIFNAIVIVITLYIALRFLLYLFDRWMSGIDPHTRTTLKFLISIVWYGIIGIAVAAAFKIDVSSIILGSAFLSIVLGLAGQTVLSNIFAGIALLVSEPVKVGERITLATWQFGNVFPTYPPKFFSHDMLINGYTGTVKTIKFMYTTMLDDEGAVVVIPNSIVIQSLIRLYTDTIYTTVRYQVNSSINVQDAIRRVNDAAGRCEDVIQKEVLIDETITTGYVIKVIAKCKGNRQDLCKSNILSKIIEEFSKP
ncbi:MAG: mechanosensitive ion channel family protein [Conexivisphaerales archaeon]